MSDYTLFATRDLIHAFEEEPMDKVNVHVSMLKLEVAHNREKHIQDYREALDGYNKKAVRWLKKCLAECEGRIKDGVKDGEAMALPHFNNSMPIPPVSHETDYDTALKKLEMCAPKEIDITDREFRQYAMDEWSWSETFKTSTAHYKSFR